MESGLFILFGRIPAMGSGLFLYFSTPGSAAEAGKPPFHGVRDTTPFHCYTFFIAQIQWRQMIVYCINIMKYKLTFIEMVEKQVYNLKICCKT